MSTRRRVTIRDLDDLFDLLYGRFLEGERRDSSIVFPERPIVIHVGGEFSPRREERPVDVNQELVRVKSEIQDLRNQLNKYLKIESREESISHFKGLISGINEISQVYVQHKLDEVVFWIFHDRGDRIEVLERVVDIEYEFERVFRNLNFDYRILPHSAMNPQIASKGELVYTRGV